VWDNKQENDFSTAPHLEWQDSLGFFEFGLFVTIFAVLEWQQRLFFARQICYKITIERLKSVNDFR
jgi:hypothetical protein